MRSLSWSSILSVLLHTIAISLKSPLSINSSVSPKKYSSLLVSFFRIFSPPCWDLPSFHFDLVEWPHHATIYSSVVWLRSCFHWTPLPRNRILVPAPLVYQISRYTRYSLVLEFHVLFSKNLLLHSLEPISSKRSCITTVPSHFSDFKMSINKRSPLMYA